VTELEPFDIAGRGVLVTGGNDGIGLAISRALAMAGASVAIWGSNPDRNAAAVKHAKDDGLILHAFSCDVRDEDAVTAAFDSTVEAIGPVRACFSNAGIDGYEARFVDMTIAEWRRVLDVNLDGTFLTLRAAARHMVDHQLGGSLVVTSSLAAGMGKPRGEHYAASKGAVISLIRSLAVELGRHGIRANALVPGWIETKIFETYTAMPRFTENVLPRVPARRWGRPEDVGGIAVYLASDASAYHTGDTLVVDGGYSRS
jgi:hypothetical protein